MFPLASLKKTRIANPTHRAILPIMSFEKSIHRKAIDLAKLSLEMTTAAGSGHPSTAMTLAHLVAVLMYHQMRYPHHGGGRTHPGRRCRDPLAKTQKTRDLTGRAPHVYAGLRVRTLHFCKPGPPMIARLQASARGVESLKS